MRPALLLIKLALRACERGDTEGAAQALRGAVAIEQDDASPTPPRLRAVTIAEFAKLLGYSAKHVRTLIARGDIPADAVLGRGKGTRLVVDLAVDALRGSRRAGREPNDEIERAGAEYVRRRARFSLLAVDHDGTQRGHRT